MAKTRDLILRAARPIVLRDGLGGTTLDRVAAEGKIAKMTLYRHFPNKEALFEGLVMAMCGYMREGIESVPLPGAEQPAESRLAEELRRFTSALIEPDAVALYRLLVADGWRFPDISRVFDHSGMRIIRQRIALLLESGAVPSAQSAQVAAEVVALALGDAYQRAVLGIVEEGDGHVFARQIDAAVVHGLGLALVPRLLLAEHPVMGIQDFNEVREIGLGLPDVSDGTAYGSPALKLAGRVIACTPTHNSADANSLAVTIDLENRLALLRDEPDIYYVTDHYAPRPVVLVRLSKITRASIMELLRTACRVVLTAAPKRASDRGAAN